MDNNDEDESDFPHMHNFSALDRIRFIEPTPEEIKAKLKKEEALKKIAKYEIHNQSFHDLMLDAALKEEDFEKYKNVSQSDETEEDGIRAEAIRREKVRRLLGNKKNN